MESIKAFFKKFNRISFGEKAKVLLPVWTTLLKLSTLKPEECKNCLETCSRCEIQEVTSLSDVQQDPDWNASRSTCDDDDTRIIPLQATQFLSTEEPTIALRDTLLKFNRFDAKNEALKDNPVPSSVVVTKSTSTFPNLLLEETNTFDNSLPESETFCFNLEEISSAKKSCGSTTYSMLIVSNMILFIFDLSNDQCPPAIGCDFYHEGTPYELLTSFLHRRRIVSALRLSRAGQFKWNVDAPDVTWISAKDRENQDQTLTPNDKKIEHGMEKTVTKSRQCSIICPKRVQYEDQQFQRTRKAELKNRWMHLYHLVGRGKAQFV
ncbi:hypothetical protein Tco_0060466 [Tanacetum coccineum]